MLNNTTGLQISKVETGKLVRQLFSSFQKNIARNKRDRGNLQITKDLKHTNQCNVKILFRSRLKLLKKKKDK